MLKQFHNLKEKHPDAVLLFRHGDFYNMFQQDTAVAAKVLGLTVHHEENNPHGLLIVTMSSSAGCFVASGL